MLEALIVAALFAQTPQLTVALRPQEPFTVGWQGYPTDQFRWWCDGAIVKNFTAAELTKGTTVLSPETEFVEISATVPGLPEGSHSCAVSSYTAFMELAGIADKKSVPIPLLVGNEARTPISLRVIVTVVIK
jgi:hypothetical protein